tara:strand:- start:4514 stop:4933 length:420 start_codon:yes stop_codon:yes gene_type:complete
MIKYNLNCKNKHEFESWFSDSKEFERLKKKNLLECIYCPSKIIEKSIMSPRILNSKKNTTTNNISTEELAKVKNDLAELRSIVEKNFEFVGDKFADTVRNVFYDKKKKNIYGTTTAEEREELKEEGIDTITIPWVKKEN